MSYFSLTNTSAETLNLRNALHLSQRLDLKALAHNCTDDDLVALRNIILELDDDGSV